MPARLERPFEEGRPGDVFALCYDKPRTGYQIAKILDIHTSMPYRMKDKYPDTFAETPEGILANVEPIIWAIEEDIEKEETETLTKLEKERIKKFLDNEWRESYGKALNSDLERQLRKDGPYRVMGTFIGVLVPWKKFYKEVSRDLDNVSDTRLQGLGPSTATELFPIVGDQIYEGDQAHSVKELLDSLNHLPDPILRKLEGLPYSKTVQKATKNELTKAKNIVKIILQCI